MTLEVRHGLPFTLETERPLGGDGWGNLLSKGVTKDSAPVMSVTADPASNRLVVSGMTYDANGNVTNMPGVGALAYDSRNRIVGTGGVPTRGYDPGNRKIWWKSSSGSTYVDFWLPNGEKLATFLLEETPVYDVNNTYFLGYVQLRATQRELYFAGRRVATQWGNTNSFTWLQPDRLSSNARHHPYGEERGTSSTEYKFATYQREASGLDYALNRYYSSVYGRFLSSDPYRASGGPCDPGSWNRYAYVQGDPVNWVDPKGKIRSCPNHDGCRALDVVADDTRTDESTGGGGGEERGGGGTGAESTEEEDKRWQALSGDCRWGLRNSGNGGMRLGLAALDRAAKYSAEMQEAANSRKLDWRLIAAIGIRESGFRDISEVGGGPGRGWFQTTPDSQITAEGASTFATAVGYAAALLRTSIDSFAGPIAEYGWNPSAVAARGFNTGPFNKYTLDKLLTGDLAELDKGTARNNYVSNTLQLMDCFK